MSDIPNFMGASFPSSSKPLGRLFPSSVHPRLRRRKFLGELLDDLDEKTGSTERIELAIRLRHARARMLEVRDRPRRTSMRIAIMGSGGIGGVVGGKLASSGTDVVFIARGVHLRAMQSSGLKV